MLHLSPKAGSRVLLSIISGVVFTNLHSVGPVPAAGSWEFSAGRFLDGSPR